MRARIGIAPDLDAAGRVRVEPAYVDAVRAAGGEPLVLDPERARPLETLGGLLLCGGAFDIPPEWYGAQPIARIDPPRLTRSQLERELLARADEAELAVLGICGGAQLMAVQRGGTLVQDIATLVPGALEHERRGAPEERTHDVELAPGSGVARALGTTRLRVNSSHHQSIERPGRCVRAVGWADDGVVEAIEDPARRYWVGVQWHPERLDDEPSRRLFAAFVEAAVSNGGSR